jgi:hypothetical protein
MCQLMQGLQNFQHQCLNSVNFILILVCLNLLQVVALLAKLISFYLQVIAMSLYLKTASHAIHESKHS